MLGEGMYSKLLSYIRAARRAVFIMTAFTDVAAIRELINIAERSVTVFIVLLRRGRNYHMEAIRQLNLELSKRSLPIRCYTRSNIHAKMYIIDYRIVIKGSINFASWSDKNVENVDIVENEDYAISAAVEFMRQLLDPDTKPCKS